MELAKGVTIYGASDGTECIYMELAMGVTVYEAFVREILAFT